MQTYLLNLLNEIAERRRLAKPPNRHDATGGDCDGPGATTEGYGESM